MRRMIFFMAIIIISMSSCYTWKKANQAMNSWVGSTKNSLISQWGAPTQVFNQNDGSEILVFENYWQDDGGGHHYCKIQMYINKSGSIYSWRGDNCARNQYVKRGKK